MAGRNSEVRVAIVADNSSLNAGLKDSQGKLASFGKMVGKVALAAGAAAAVGLGALAKASIDAANEAQQSMGATHSIFGKFAADAIKTSRQAATQFGLSANDYREQANMLGALLKNQGVAQDKLAAKTKSMVGTAADLAATFGGPVSDAVEALTSAFKGEFDPLEKYGISIKQSTVNTEAWRLAHVKSLTEFKKFSTAQQRAYTQQATANLITKQSAIAQGQFAKQTNTLAEQQQILGAQWDNLKAKIGKALLPAVTALFKVLNQDLMPALRRLANQYLPPVARAIREWAQSGDPGEMMRKLADNIKHIDWGHIADQLGDIGSALHEALPQLKEAGSSTISDGFNVLGVALKFAADHIEILTKALPFLVAGFALFKTAQLANQIAGKDSVVGLIAQIAVTRQLKAATDQLAQSTKTLTTATTQQAGASEEAALQAGAAQGGISKMGIAARGAAGVAGMALLATNTGKSNEALSTLQDVAGGALMGFAAGGPWGAAIGAGAGLLGSLVKHIHAAGDAAKDVKPDFSGLASTLDETTGAITEQTAAWVYNDLATSGVLKSLNAMGVNSRTAVQAILGHKKAQDALNVTLDKEQTSVDFLSSQIATATAARERYRKGVQLGNTADIQAWNTITDSIDAMKREQAQRQGNIDRIRAETGAVKQGVKDKRSEIRATQDLSGLIGKLPKRKATQIIAAGINPSLKGVANVAKRYKLLPKQIKSVIDVLGVPYTVKQVEKVKKKLEDAGKTKPDFRTFTNATNAAIADAAINAGRKGKDISDKLKSATHGAKPDLKPFTAALSSTLASAKTTASSGGQGVGASLKSGVLTGSSGLGPALSTQMTAAVNQGINAARRAAGAHSPSRKMMKLGLDLTKGLEIGVQRGSAGVEKVLTTLANQTTRILARQLHARQASIRAQFKGKEEEKHLSALNKSWSAHSKHVQKAVSDERDALRKLGKEQDALASGNFLKFLDKSSKLYKRMADAGVHNLEEARSALSDLKQTARDYAQSIKDSFVAFGDITQLGVNADTGAVDIKQLLDQLAARQQQAQRFATLIKRLQSEGLNRAQIEQLTAAGVEGGLATAQAIQSALDSGQADVIKQINDMSNAIADAGGDLGDTLASRYYDAGIQAAQGLVDGLEAKAKELDKTAVKLANALVRAIKKALGIKSPSTVMQAIGADVSRGLALGVNDTHARDAGRSLASSLVSAFGSPTLGASATAPGFPVRVSVQLSGQQVSALERGRQIQLDLDTYQRAGGRRRL